MGCRWGNDVCYPRWNIWTDDTSKSQHLKLEPDSNDRIYDIDAPTIGGEQHNDTNEAYINFRQYVKWNDEQCSDFSYWYWNARWEYLKDPKVPFMDVGSGKKEIPEKSYFKK